MRSNGYSGPYRYVMLEGADGPVTRMAVTGPTDDEREALRVIDRELAYHSPLGRHDREMNGVEEESDSLDAILDDWDDLDFEENSF